MAKRSVRRDRERSKSNRETLAALPNVYEGTVYHVNRDGSVSPCRREFGECLLGVDTVHYQEYAEAVLAGVDLIAKNPEITNKPEQPHEDLYYQELVDDLGSNSGWYSKYNGYVVGAFTVSDMIKFGMSHKEYVKHTGTDYEGEHSDLLGEKFNKGPEVLDIQIAKNIDNMSVYDKDTEIDYRLSVTYEENNPGQVKYLSVDAYKYGVWTKEHSIYLPAGSIIDRGLIPWSIK